MQNRCEIQQLNDRKHQTKQNYLRHTIGGELTQKERQQFEIRMKENIEPQQMIQNVQKKRFTEIPQKQQGSFFQSLMQQPEKNSLDSLSEYTKNPCKEQDSPSSFWIFLKFIFILTIFCIISYYFMKICFNQQELSVWNLLKYFRKQYQ